MKNRIKLASLGEFSLIERIREFFPRTGKVLAGIGEDTAVFPCDQRHYSLLTVDTVVDGVDFRLKKVRPEQAGWKALAVSLSDIAAMGGLPLYALVSLGLPGNMDYPFIRRFYAGMKRLSKIFNVSVVGGDLSRSKVFFASVTLLGKVEKRKVCLRSKAKAGDFIFVTGSLGGSILGKHLSFMPRLRESRFLVRNFSVHAMIDISDGLLQDLGHILEESGKGALVFGNRIPVSRDAFRLLRRKKRSPLHSALCDGEDFELLFTLSPTEAKKMLKLRSGLLGTPVSCIGKITKERGVRLQMGENSTARGIISCQGYEHF